MNENIFYTPALQKLFDMQKRAIETKDKSAQFYLACCFMKSKQKSTQKKAFAFFKKLANQDYTKTQTDAQYRLAQCYENGYGITKSYSQACKWYENVHYNVHNDVYKMFEKQLNSQIEKVLDEPEQEITPEVLDCITESAENGDLESQKYLMDLYRFGKGNIEQDMEEAAYWAEQAAINGDVKSMYEIGCMYYDGRDVNKNIQKALYWLEKATAKGNHDAPYLLGIYYKTQNQFKTAVKWFKLCADLSLKWRSKKIGNNAFSINDLLNDL